MKTDNFELTMDFDTEDKALAAFTKLKLKLISCGEIVEV